MKHKVKDMILTVLRYVPLVLCIAFMAIYLFSGQEVTAESLLDYAPENPLHAAIFLILLYAFKSLTVFFPIIVLNVLGGFLFEPVHALMINAIGVLVELAVPYCIGRASGAGFADKMRGKYPKLNEFIGENSDNNFFMSFPPVLFLCFPRKNLCFRTKNGNNYIENNQISQRFIPRLEYVPLKSPFCGADIS